jgi:hypothetical protein
LEELPKERKQPLGKDHPAVQMLRDQINEEKSGKTFQELHLTGAVASGQTLQTQPPSGEVKK